MISNAPNPETITTPVTGPMSAAVTPEVVALGARAPEPTKEQLRAHNRAERLANHWAYRCPRCVRDRLYTTKRALVSHFVDYHRFKIRAADGALLDDTGRQIVGIADDKLVFADEKPAEPESVSG